MGAAFAFGDALEARAADRSDGTAGSVDATLHGYSMESGCRASAVAPGRFTDIWQNYANSGQIEHLATVILLI